MVLICCRFTQDILQNGFGFWVDSLLHDAVDSRRLSEVVNWPIEWTALQLGQAWHCRLKSVFEFLAPFVNWIASNVNIVQLIESLAKILDISPRLYFVVIHPKLLQGVGLGIET